MECEEVSDFRSPPHYPNALSWAKKTNLIAVTSARVVYIVVRTTPPNCRPHLKNAKKDLQAHQRLTYARCHKGPYDFRVGDLLEDHRTASYSSPGQLLPFTSVLLSATIPIQARKGPHIETLYQACFPSSSMVASRLWCSRRVSLLCSRAQAFVGWGPYHHFLNSCRCLLAASTVDDRVSIFRAPNNRLMSEWVEVGRRRAIALCPRLK